MTTPDKKPDVIVDFVFDRGVFYLVIANIGDAPACDISVKFDREIWGLEGKKLISAMPLFTGVYFLPPQKKIATFVDTSASYFRRQQPVNIKIRITFQDRDHNRYRSNIRHNLEIYRDIGFIKRQAD